MEDERKTLIELQQDLIDQIGSGDLDDVTSEPVRQMFDSVNKAIAEERKAENERLRIEAENARAARDAEVAELRSKRELAGNRWRTAGQIGAAVIAGGFGLVMGNKILFAEDHDILCNSRAWSWIFKPRG